MNLFVEPFEKTLKKSENNEEDNGGVDNEGGENEGTQQFNTTKECYDSLDPVEIDEVIDILTFTADSHRNLLELVQCNPMKYVAIIEHDPRCKELNLPIWTNRIHGNLFVKFKVSAQSPPIETGFSETCDDPTILADLKTSIHYWLTYDDHQLAVQRRNIALLGNDQHETLSKVGHNLTNNNGNGNNNLIPDNIDSILSKNDQHEVTARSQQQQQPRPQQQQQFNQSLPQQQPIVHIVHENENKNENKNNNGKRRNNRIIKSQTITVTTITSKPDGTINTKTTTTTNSF